MTKPILQVDRLRVRIRREGESDFYPVNIVSFHIHAGRTTALVGESGSGKSLTAWSIMGLLPGPADIERGTITLDGCDVTGSPEDVVRDWRGTKMAMVFQEPMTALNPAMQIGDQLAEVLTAHTTATRDMAWEIALEKLRLVGIPDPEKRLREYPHQLSGGMRQRVVIAMALMADAKLLIADEPTTALDVTIQAQILELLQELQERIGVAILLITHDMGVVAQMAHNVCVMKGGEIIERGTAQDIFDRPQMPYTKHLLSAVPRMGTAEHYHPTRGGTTLSVPQPLLEARDLQVHFRQGRGRVVRAVDGIDLKVWPKDVVGLVGESGCGKSTLGKALMRIVRPTAGSVWLGGAEVTGRSRSLKRLRERMSFIFQDPMSSLDPRMRVRDIVMEPLVIQRVGTRRSRLMKATELLERVGLGSGVLNRYAHEFSGGQKQRIGIARALITDPDFVVCDEPTSALDVSVQADVLTLLKELRDDLGLTMLFISHDLAVVEQIANRVAVMYLGRFVEIGSVGQVIRDPQNPYTQALISAVPVPDPSHDGIAARLRLNGSPPSPSNPPSGCRFHTRCPFAVDRCSTLTPTLERRDDGRLVSCLLDP